MTVQIHADTWTLTGAIGTGKSTVGSLLAARGARVIDADRIGHGVIDPSGPAFPLVAERWPEVVVDDKIDRRLLGSIVFSDAAQLAELEAITHPLIVARLAELVDASTSPVAVVEVSVPHLPIDARWGRIVVVASEAIRRERLLERGLTPDELEQRIAAQPPAPDWVRPGDVVIDNDGDLEQLEAHVDAVWMRLQTGD
ncbi:MAG: dephospho-CoA kinase [Acidimicrobiia bacterium]